jgi:hypothetical protein
LQRKPRLFSLICARCLLQGKMRAGDPVRSPYQHNVELTAAATRGVPTSYAAKPLKKSIVPGDEPPPVWPFAEGPVRGYAFSPLHKNVPKAALADPQLYELLALVDALRDGKARERELAARELSKRLEASPDVASKP